MIRDCSFQLLDFDINLGPLEECDTDRDWNELRRPYVIYTPAQAREKCYNDSLIAGQYISYGPCTCCPRWLMEALLTDVASLGDV